MSASAATVREARGVPAPVEAVSVALLDGDRVLLVKRGRAPSLGLYAFPGGRIEPGETAEAAARREVAEETGLRCGPLALHEAITIPAEAPGSPCFHLSVFVCEAHEGEPAAADDAAEAAFFRLDELEALPITHSTLAIARVLLTDGHRT